MNRYNNFDSIICNSLSITQAITVAPMAVPTDAPVLLLGETGNGKKVFLSGGRTFTSRPFFNIVDLNTI